MTHHRPSEPVGDYEIGYKRPPDGTKFKEGNQAAHKGGRPKGSKNHSTIVKEVAAFRFDAGLPGGKSRKMTLWEAGFWKLAAKGAQGDLKSWSEYTRILEQYGVAVPIPAPIDDAISDDEDQMAEKYFLGWARLHPERAAELLRDLDQVAPRLPPLPVVTCISIEGRPTVRRVFFDRVGPPIERTSPEDRSRGDTRAA